MTQTITLEYLLQVMPRLPKPKAIEYLPHLNKACSEWGITTKFRQAAFLAQVAHESGELRYWQEFADGLAYEMRFDLGNLHDGDGPRYRGRGPLQLTGRANYRKAGLALGLDLEGKPIMVLEPEVGFRASAWYWHTKGLNELADRLEFTEVTRRVNGGTNGWRERVAYYARAL